MKQADPGLRGPQDQQELVASRAKKEIQEGPEFQENLEKWGQQDLRVREDFLAPLELLGPLVSEALEDPW